MNCLMELASLSLFVCAVWKGKTEAEGGTEDMRGVVRWDKKGKESRAAFVSSLPIPIPLIYSSCTNYVFSYSYIMNWGSSSVFKRK